MSKNFFFFCEDKLKHTNVFGVPLGQVMYTSYTEFRIPQFVVELFKILEQTGKKS